MFIFNPYVHICVHKAFLYNFFSKNKIFIYKNSYGKIADKTSFKGIIR